MSSKALLSIVATVVAAVLVIFFPKFADSGAGSATAAATRSTSPEQARDGQASIPSTPEPATPKPSSTTPASTSHSASGFGSRQAFDEHYAKHGSEFGDVTREQYLTLAQNLRDAPVGGSILEAVRGDGVISRFDEKSGAFIAFNENRTIRTFFKPNDGVRYFERQIGRAH